MSETLYLQRLLIEQVERFHKNLDSDELVLRKWEARGPARIMLLAAWLRARTNKTTDAAIDLRGAQLTPYDGVQLAKLLHSEKTLTAVDVRHNETLGAESDGTKVPSVIEAEEA